MPRLAQINMFIGFAVLFFAASVGTFIASEITYTYLREKSFIDTWLSLLTKSAHGHTNMFALIHICFGLTIPYSYFGRRINLLQTIGLGCGTFSMSFLMVCRGIKGPVEGVDMIEVAIGTGLSLALISIASHAIGLGGRIIKRIN